MQLFIVLFKQSKISKGAMMAICIGSRYRKGFILKEFKSVELCGDDEKDCLIKRFFVQAQEEDPIARCWVLVIFSEVEVVAINKQGVDDGFMEFGREIYKFPFIEDARSRKQILRTVITNLNKIIMTTPGGYW